VLVGAVDRRVHRHNPVDLSGGVGLCQQDGVDPVPDPVRRETAVAFPHRLPWTELFRQVPPCNSAPVPVSDALDNLSMVPERAAALAIRAGQQWLNAGPLIISKNLETRHEFKFSSQPSGYLGDTP
jgi:hypothetical protein